VMANLVRELSGQEVSSVRAILIHIERAGVEAAGAFRARLAAKAADTEPAARAELVRLVADPSELASAQAILHLQNAAQSRRSWLVPAALVPFSDASRFSSRLGALQVTVILVRSGATDVDDIVGAWLSAGHRRHTAGAAPHPAEATALLELAHAYLRDGGGTDVAVLDAVGRLVEDLTNPVSDDITVRKATPGAAQDRGPPPRPEPAPGHGPEMPRHCRHHRPGHGGRRNGVRPGDSGEAGRG